MLAVLCFFGMRYLFAGGGGLGPPSPPSATYAAYTKGFQDGKSGADFDPIADSPTIVEQAPSSGGGWGIGKLMSLVMAGTMVYQLGGGGGGAPWSIEAVLANARNMNPMNLMVMLNLLSGLFS